VTNHKCENAMIWYPKLTTMNDIDAWSMENAHTTFNERGILYIFLSLSSQAKVRPILKWPLVHDWKDHTPFYMCINKKRSYMLDLNINKFIIFNIIIF